MCGGGSVDFIIASENVEARSAIRSLETPLRRCRIRSNVADESVRIPLRPTPTRGAARPLVRRDHLEVSGKQMTSRPQSIQDERLSQQESQRFALPLMRGSGFPTRRFRSADNCLQQNLWREASSPALRQSRSSWHQRRWICRTARRWMRNPERLLEKRARYADP